MIPAHSPSIAQACVQSSGVLALHPSKGVRTSPPLIASAGSSGTAVVARKLARLLQSAMTHSSDVGWMDYTSCFKGTRITRIGAGGIAWWHASIWGF